MTVTIEERRFQAALRKLLRDDESWDLFVLLRTTSLGSLEELERAVEVLAEGRLDVEANRLPLLTDLLETRSGITGYLYDIDAEEPDSVLTYLGLLADRLTTAGIDGTFTVARPAEAPLDLDHPGRRDPTADPPRDRRWLAAFVAYTFDADLRAVQEAERPSGSFHWGISDEDRHHIADALTTWIAPGGDHHFTKRGVVRSPNPDRASQAAMLDRNMARGLTSVLYCYDDPALTGRKVATKTASRVTADLLGPQPPWPDVIDQLRDLLTALPLLTATAFIRPTELSGQFAEAGTVMPPAKVGYLPYRNTGLLDRYVLDANGVQVLTDAHLDRAHDLSAWTITPLGHGRHLVEAPDLAPWYANVLPQPDVLDQARHDFGPMILTPAVIAADDADR